MFKCCFIVWNLLARFFQPRGSNPECFVERRWNTFGNFLQRQENQGHRSQSKFSGAGWNGILVKNNLILLIFIECLFTSCKMARSRNVLSIDFAAGYLAASYFSCASRSLMCLCLLSFILFHMAQSYFLKILQTKILVSKI